MIAWLSENLITILICLVIAVFLVLAVINLVRNRKKGGKCSCGCDGCAYSGSCGEAVKSSGEKAN
ncbi:MAG: FeoB-associated Cys-rich membrane protein [Clostridiales bacterium]|nr:FeoB-associated Cys-rich membrane protein [Clostridiales bacterium]